MNSMVVIDVLSRWLHVATAIVVLGGTVFFRFVLLPAAEELPQIEHDRLRQQVMGRWRKIVGAGIGLFLLSGFYNYLTALPRHHHDALYHGLMGIKIVLAIVVFFLASALAGRAARFEALRRERKKWLVVLVVLAFLIVLISSSLKVARPGVVNAAPEKPLANTTN